MKYILALLLISISHFLLAQSQEKKTEPFIDQLEVGDTMIIDITSNGCRHLWREQIQVVKSQNGYTTYYADQKSRLSKREIRAIRKFEKAEMPQLCATSTTQNIFTVTLGQEKREKTDVCDEWNGYGRLLKKLRFKKVSHILHPQ